MTTDEQISEIEMAIKTALAELGGMERYRDDLYRQRSKEKYGIEAGLRVREKRTGREGVVQSVRPEAWATQKPWLCVKLIKKDGRLGEREAIFYGDWEIVQAAQDQLAPA